jgi:hypothetical protein
MARKSSNAVVASTIKTRTVEQNVRVGFGHVADRAVGSVREAESGLACVEVMAIEADSSSQDGSGPVV